MPTPRLLENLIEIASDVGAYWDQADAPWRALSDDEQRALILKAAEALTAYEAAPGNEALWAAYSWALTCDAIAEALITDAAPIHVEDVESHLDRPVEVP